MLAMIDLLGADNLDDGTLAVLKRLWKRRTDLRDSISPGEMDETNEG
jgi:hypothetical protein